MRGKRAATAKVVTLSGEPSRKPIITDEHRAEAAALKRLFEAFQQRQADKGVKVTQIGFAGDMKIGTQGLLWQYLNAKIPLNLKTAMKFAQGIGCRIEDFSPRLAGEQAALAPAAKEPKQHPKTQLETLLQLGPLERQLLGMYRELREDQKDELLQLANKLHAQSNPEPSAANPYGSAPRKTPAKAER